MVTERSVVAVGKTKGQERITKGQEETSEGDGYVPYLDYGEGFTRVYVCQNSADCTL